MSLTTEQENKRSNRSRYTSKKKKSGVLKPTPQTALALCDPLSRYRELPSSILGALYNAIVGNRPESVTYLETLTNLTHEAEGMTDTRRLLSRPEYQKRFGLNTEAIYRKTIGTVLHARSMGVYDEEMVQWANNTHLSRFMDEGEPERHDKQLAVIAASIEVAARRDRGFITHMEILKHASDEAKAADRPLSIPVPYIQHTFKDGTRSVKDTHVEPDWLFGLPVIDGGNFYVLERDRSTEDMLPTKSLTRKSWLKIILMYSAISEYGKAIYGSYLGLPNLQVLPIFISRNREAHFHELVRQYARYPNQFASTVVSDFDPVLMPDLMPQLYHEPVWTRADGSKFSLKERR